jgi:hypothetical protein
MFFVSVRVFCCRCNNAILFAIPRGSYASGSIRCIGTFVSLHWCGHSDPVVAANSMEGITSFPILYGMDLFSVK